MLTSSLPLLVKVGLIEIAIGPHRGNIYRLSNGWRTVNPRRSI